MAMAKPLTEAAAWAWLAKKWDTPTIDDDGWAVVNVPTPDCPEDGGYGLCPCLECMLQAGMVTEATFESMNGRMATHWPQLAKPNYRWSTNAAGAKKRAAFCRKLARLAKPKARKAAPHGQG